ncbi:MAG: hypothetical protein WAT89_08295, partial [Candidatus Kapaibacterium sp.]
MRLSVKELACIIFYQQYNALPTSLKYLMECPNYQHLYTSRVYNCYFNCVYYNFKNPNNYKLVISPKECNFNGGCCVFKRKICFNKQTNSQEIID